MIFVTTGTNEQPFDRLVHAARRLSEGDEEVVVQYSSSRAPHGRGRWIEFLSFEEMEATMRAARVVVAHAGVGSILLAHRCGRRPVVMARRVSLREAVDDHQVGLAARLAQRGLVTVVDDDAQLLAAVGAPASALAAGAPSAGGLADELRSTLVRLTAHA